MLVALLVHLVGTVTLWDQTFGAYLADPLWREENAYDAGLALMVPLHHSFNTANDDRITAFSDQVKRFLDSSSTTLATNRLARIQYLYLVSRYLVLAHENGVEPQLCPRAAQRLYHWVNRYWRVEPAIHYHQPTFPNMRSRVIYKLNTLNPPYKHDRAIIDEELYTFAIAADLATYERISGTSNAFSPVVHDILDFGHRIFVQRSNFRPSGWLFDIGSWSDHRDYVHAGQLSLLPDLQPLPVPSISPDSSHSARMPRFLRSLEDAYPVGSPKARFFARCRSELERQFVEHVLISPKPWFPGFRTRNFLDGRNGVYRYGYWTNGDRLGYGPYELSGTFTLGWWAFLGTERIRQAYASQSTLWPLADSVRRTYLGPGTVRYQHPIPKMPECFTNGVREQLCVMASELD
ncbi:MAG TPA: hypothetical protein PKA27_13290 [Fimbriimonadaceae bacterium]|nr:hypothetical protein [Fimbriimonadaceae bacterium]